MILFSKNVGKCEFKRKNIIYAFKSENEEIFAENVHFKFGLSSWLYFRGQKSLIKISL